MNNLKHILKIESNGKTVLFSQNAKQRIDPIGLEKLKRNLDMEIIPQKRQLKYKCYIETEDPLDCEVFNMDNKFLIHSIVPIRETGAEIPKLPYVKDSVIEHDGYIEYCPILETFLTNFRYNSSEDRWFLEFEET